MAGCVCGGSRESAEPAAGWRPEGGGGAARGGRTEAEAGGVELDGGGGGAGEVEEGLGDLAAADGAVAAVRLGVGLLQQTHPQLAPVRPRERQPGVRRVLRPPRPRGAGQEVVHLAR